MVSSLIKRVEKAEQVDGGDGECPRCEGTVIVRFLGTITVIKNQKQLGPEAAHQFVAEAESNGGRCPVCEQPWVDAPIEFRPGSSFYR